MKKLSLFLLAVLTLAACSNSKTEGADGTEATKLDAKLVMPIAVINVDSILSEYTFAKESNEKLIKKQEDSRLNLNTKGRQLQNEMVDFQRKLENNAFLSRERAEQESRRLQQKEADLQKLGAQLSEDLMAEQQKLSEQLRENISEAIKVLNKDNKYHLVVSTNSMNDNILFAAPEYDITKEVIAYLNNKYKK